jgi:exodeoxyribonuclease VII large subunit
MQRENYVSGGKRVYNVSEFSSEVRHLLEQSYAELWIEGEVSGVSNPRSGHSYFSIKDQKAQIRCALFKQRKLRCAVMPTEGAQVLMRARVSLYEARGDFQLIVDYVEDAGEGALRRAMELLKKQLQNEGLFNNEIKTPPPAIPAGIGIITSATGAAIHDILITLKKAAPWIPVVIYPTLVQGADAPKAIVNAIQTADRRKDCDVLLLVRGGGSFEDLNAFNSESVARALFNCQLPVIAGIGHESDISIADFVADVRAATPTAAAQYACRESEDRLDHLVEHKDKLIRAMDYKLNNLTQLIDTLAAKLRHPTEAIQLLSSRLQNLKQRFKRMGELSLDDKCGELSNLQQRLERMSPEQRVSADKSRLEYIQSLLEISIKRKLASFDAALISNKLQLSQLNPSNILARGSSALTREDGTIISSIKDVMKDQKVEALVSDGRIPLKVRN